ncbi:alpha/beta fold hydrolase [Vibrio nigripulchritudo]|uniref:alpha/beta fold hydrolase n=1 Tax=Vibrio nigripulchritudo TaxID=28173 RepID=UPI0003B1AFA3|nr:alpha/beta hydrolase [Vibrio nigripulchritudo]CCN72693.1 putative VALACYCLOVIR HYDROLASE [Vibrio nigripulchritudo SFn118]
MFQQEGHLKIDGASIYYEVSGDPTGKPLLFLHGGLGCMYDLNPLLDFVPNGYKVISVDFRGHGQSTIGELPLSYQRYQEDIEALLSHLKVTRYSIFGFSDGGIVAYRLASAHPDSVEKVVTLGSQWRLTENDPVEPILSSLSVEMWREKFPKDVSRYEEINPQPDFSALIDRVKAVWLDRSETGYPANQMTSITCPVLIIRGDNDFLFSREEATYLVDLLPDSAFMNVPFSEHATHQEHPEMIGLALNQFL